MKTVAILNSSDRDLFGKQIRHDTNKFLSLTDLQEAYTQKRVKEGWAEKRIDNILNYKDNHERIFYILKEQQLITTTLEGFIEMVDNKGIATVLKSLGVYKTTGARKNKSIWCNPYIFLLIALELNPEFYARVIMWLGDNLIANRIEAGNFYKELSRAMSKFPNVDYVRVAKGLNYCIFGRHETGLRNSATQKELKELENLESKMAFAIDMGYITSFEMLISELTKIYKQRQLNHYTSIKEDVLKQIKLG